MVIQVSALILLASAVGILAIVLPKVPRLKELPQEEWGVRDAVRGVAARLTENGYAERVKPEKWLHRILVRARILALKADRRLAGRLEKMRRQGREQSGRFEEEYWKRLKGKRE